MTPAETSVGDLVLWVVAATSVIGFLMSIWTIFSGPSKQNASQIDMLRKRVDAQDLKISSLEQATAHLPSQGDMHQVSLSIEGLKGEMKAMRAEAEGSKAILLRLESIVARHDNHLLKS